jgi:hypothetical protein
MNEILYTLKLVAIIAALGFVVVMQEIYLQKRRDRRK